MPHYDKIVAILMAWKEEKKHSGEHRNFFVAPHPKDFFSYNISAIIKLDASDGKQIKTLEKSEVLTLKDIAREIPDLEEKIKTLKDFLDSFTKNFYNKLERN